MSARRRKLLLWTVSLLILFVGIGEVLSRSEVVQRLIPNDAYDFLEYGSAKNQLKRFSTYVHDYGIPNCVLLGSSLVQVGIDPEVFRQALMVESGITLDCYNFGMDASTLSSTEKVRTHLSKQYHPKYYVLGISAFQFRPADSSHLLEDSFFLDPASLSDWLSVNSVLYRTIRYLSTESFPKASEAESNADPAKTGVRPEVPRSFQDSGYAPLPGYRDASPLWFDSTKRDLSSTDIDPQDLVAFQAMIHQAVQGEFQLIIVQMPLPHRPSNEAEIIDRMLDYARSEGIPVLSMGNAVTMPPTAFSDNHLHIYGSQMFSAWLGTQIGKAFAANALDKVDDPVWFPEVKEWAPPTALATLGLKDTSYQAYQAFLEQFKLVPFDVVIYLPSDERFTRNFLQTLLGFESDWRKDMTDEERHKRYELMSLLEQARYLSELPAAQTQRNQLAQWQETLDSTLLAPLNVRYVLCRQDRANPDVEYCPKGLADSPQYKLMGTWNLDPLYETYTLYQIESARANR